MPQTAACNAFTTTNKTENIAPYVGLTSMGFHILNIISFSRRLRFNDFGSSQRAQLKKTSPSTHLTDHH